MSRQNSLAKASDSKSGAFLRLGLDGVGICAIRELILILTDLKKGVFFVKKIGVERAGRTVKLKKE